MRPCGCPNDVLVFGHVSCWLAPPPGEPISPCAGRACLIQHFDPQLVAKLVPA